MGLAPARFPEAWFLGVAVLDLPEAEALHLADHTSEALETIAEAEAWVERSQERCVFLAPIGADGTGIEASFCTAIRIAKEQKSVLLQKRAEATYAEYR